MTTELAAEKIKLWWDRPDVCVRELFGVTPDPWQDSALRSFPLMPRLAMKASKGPGKSCVLAWIAWNFLLTRPHPNIAATSISADNLRDNLWKEMAVWYQRSPLLQRLFDLRAERITSREHPKTWWMAARSWARTANPDQLGNTLAGLHSDYLLFLLDECGAMPVPILESAEAGFSSAKECHIAMAGNTNSLDGALYFGCVKHAALWHVIVITGDPDNPLRSSRVSLDWAREMIRTYGRESPFIKVMVLGEWPAASLNALIGPDEVEEAMRRAYREFQYRGAPKILGVDVAREGDDQSVIFPREGIIAWPPLVYRNIDSLQGAGAVARKWQEWGADACFVDATGGFGAAWIDQLRVLGRQPIAVQYAGTPHEPSRYVNKRAEMYFDLVAWIKAGGQLPPIPELTSALTQTCYSFKGDRLLLEPKEIVKAKIGYSPDHADALAQTFSEPVTPKGIDRPFRRQAEVTEYDPFRESFNVPAPR